MNDLDFEYYTSLNTLNQERRTTSLNLATDLELEQLTRHYPEIDELKPGYKWYVAEDRMFLSGGSWLVELDMENQLIGRSLMLSIS
jgi:hypothetical protein